MTNRTKIIEKELNVILPQDYKEFINKVGIISDERGEVFGYIENIDIEKIPCIIGATKLYKKDYKILTDNEIVISFDDFQNKPVILNTKNGSIYLVDFDNKIQISKNFAEWLKQKSGDNK